MFSVLPRRLREVAKPDRLLSSRTELSNSFRFPVLEAEVKGVRDIGLRTLDPEMAKSPPVVRVVPEDSSRGLERSIWSGQRCLVGGIPEEVRRRSGRLRADNEVEP